MCPTFGVQFTHHQQKARRQPLDGGLIDTEVFHNRRERNI